MRPFPWSCSLWQTIHESQEFIKSSNTSSGYNLLSKCSTPINFYSICFGKFWRYNSRCKACEESFGKSHLLCVLIFFFYFTVFFFFSIRSTTQTWILHSLDIQTMPSCVWICRTLLHSAVVQSSKLHSEESGVYLVLILKIKKAHPRPAK